MKRNFSTKLAAVFCAFLMVMPDIMASTNALRNMQLDEVETVSSVIKHKLSDINTAQEVVDLSPEVENSVDEINDEIKPAIKMLIVPSSDLYGVIGRGEKDPLGNPQDDIFLVTLDEELTNGSAFAFLKYQVRGVSEGSSIPKSINSNPTFGTLDFIASDVWVETTEPLAMNQLKSGSNYVRFSVPNSIDLPVEIKDVQIVFSDYQISDKENSVLALTACTDQHLFTVLPKESVPARYALSDLDVPSIPSNIINVTKGAYAYGFIENNGSERVGVGIDVERIPAGMDIKDVQTYFFDYDAKKWTAIAYDSIALKADYFSIMEAEASEGTPGEGDVNFVPSQGATQYFNGLIKSPEMPEASAFMPTTIQDIKAANPAEGMNIMQPPGISQTGDANISYPLAITPGRNGMTPQLALSYNSSQGTGPMGVGWNISTPKVVVDTRWGVPEFDEVKETEVYSLNGKSLRMEGKSRANRPELTSGEPLYTNRPSKTEVRFFEKTMTAYKEIERHGTGPKSYYWIETHADLSKYFYGNYDGNQINSTLEDDNGNIAEWHLMKIEDKWGNYIKYSYVEKAGTNNPMLAGGKAMMVSKIEYTGHTNSSPMYSVEFNYSPSRADATISLRYGFKVVDEFRLDKVLAKYNNTEYRNFMFTYETGAFGITRLKNVKEYRHGNFFYQHDFTYKGLPAQAFSAPIQTQFSNTLFNLADILGLAPSSLITTNDIENSAIGTSWNYGYSAGAYMGFGFGVNAFSKINTGGTELSFGQNWNRGKNTMVDVDGDGMIDIMMRQGNDLQYRSLDISPTAISAGLPKTLSGVSDFMKGKTTNTGINFQGNPLIAFFGTNTQESDTRTSFYITDYNADGLPDIVENGQVKFARKNAAGNIVYEGNSQNTPNPVYLGVEAESTPGADQFIDLETVRQWRAPFTGTVNVTGTASLSATSVDGVEVGIQKNSSFIVSFRNLNKNASLTMNKTALAVVKGDVLLFRVRSKANGFDDLVNWDPQIRYTNVSAVDANGINYTDVKASQAFLLSQNDVIRVGAGGEALIEWDMFNPTNLTDQVEFMVTIQEYDVNGSKVGGLLTYSKEALPNQTNTIVPSYMTNKGVSSYIDQIFSGYTPVGSNADGSFEITFSAKSTSNVNWQQLFWRPRVKWRPQPSSTAVVYYPNVDFGFYQEIVHFGGAYSPGALSGNVQVYPSFSGMNFSQLTGSANLNFVIKSDNSFIKELSVTINPSGVVNYFDPISQTALPFASFNEGQIFSSADFPSGRLFFELSTENAELAAILSGAVQIKLFDATMPVGNQPGVLNLNTSHRIYNAWHKKAPSVAGAEYRGFGQFLWTKDSKLAIKTSDLVMPSFNQNSFDLNNQDLEQLANQMQLLGLNISSVKAWSMVAQRSEYVLEFKGVAAGASVDRWAGPGMNVMVSAQKMFPGKLGEFQEDPDFQDPPPLPITIYSASAPIKSSQSKSVAWAGGVGVGPLSLSGSSTEQPDANNMYGSFVTREFMDFNGDRYPDNIGNSFSTTSELVIQFTNQFGGLKEWQEIPSINGQIGVSWPTSDGLVLGGTFANQKASANGGYTQGKSDAPVTWADINGDGLSDKISLFGTNMTKIELNAGKSFYTSVIDQPNLKAMKTHGESQDFSLGLGVNIGNKSISAGLNWANTDADQEQAYTDINGDGLTDYVTGDNIYINTGSDFVLFSLVLPTPNPGIDKSNSFGVNGSGTFGVTGTVVPVKVVTTPSTSANMAVSSSRRALMDVNSDGFVDIVEADKINGDYTLSIRLNQLNQVNLLEKVENPIGGSFDMTYKSIGNRYGECEPTIQNPTLSQPNNEKMLWDMAQQKQVLASVTVHDKLDVDNPQQGIGYPNTPAPSGDLSDGTDSYTTTFYYDGGIYSSREREFLGFSRIETRSPARTADDIPLNIGEELLYTSSLVEYAKPASNDFQDMVEYEYLANLPTSSYTLVSTLEHVLISDPEDYFDDYSRHLTQATYNTYTYYPIGQYTGQSTFNKADLNSALNPANLSLGEAECIFPALTKTETFSFLVPGDLQHYSYLYELEYDEYMNVTVAVDGGLSKSTLAIWSPILDEFARVDEHTLVQVNELIISPLLEGPIIALMDYFPPGDAGYQTNMLQMHRVYVTNTSDPTNLRRKSTVDGLTDDWLAPMIISQWLDHAPSENSTSTLAYDGYGNITRVTGPSNHKSDQLTIDYTYETAQNQYITTVSNSYGDQTCMDYNYATGTPKYTIDPNGYVLYFEYDNADRPKRVFGPREYADGSTPYTLEFDYYPQGFDPTSGVFGEGVPVAITRHYVGESAKAAPQTSCTAAAPGTRPSAAGTDIIRTATFIDGLGRVAQVKKDASWYNPNTQQNERRQEVSGMTTYDWQGMTTQETLSWLENSTNLQGFSTFNTSPSNGTKTAAIYEYDLLNRVKRVFLATANKQAVASNYPTSANYHIATAYSFSSAYDGTMRFMQNVEDNQHDQKTQTQKFFNSKSAVVATKTLNGLIVLDEITTQFEYDLLGQMTKTTNPLGLETTYAYDWFGRAYTENHPDRGVTSSNFDKAGNVIQITTANATVNMTYDYNRLKTKSYPSTPSVNNVTYTYGAAGDGKNGAGRVTSVLQGNNVVQEFYKYDELGQVSSENKTIAIPLVGEMKFVTTYNYDSWGRIKNMAYPDGENVRYTYAQAGGELESVSSFDLATQTSLLDYVSHIGYDGYGNQQYLRYGNEVVTEKDYSPFNRAMNLVEITSPHSTGTPDLLNKTITYQNNGNIKEIENTAPSFGQGWNNLGGTYKNTYTYDYANRLATSLHKYDGQSGVSNAATYDLTMTYNVAGGITSKTQSVTGNGQDPNMAYTLTYDYLKQNNNNNKDKHRLNNIYHNGIAEKYTYDLRGNVTKIENHPEWQTQQFVWDEADRLRAVKNNGGLHHYVYDGTGTRILKGSYTEQTIQLDGQQPTTTWVMSPYTVYVNPYMVCTYYADDVDITKHYYAGAQRVASKLYQHGYNLSWEASENPQGLSNKTEGPMPYSFFFQEPVENNTVIDDATNIAGLLGFELGGQFTLPGRVATNLAAYPPCNESFNPNQMQEGQSYLEYYDCLCRYYPEEAQAQGVNCDMYTEVYWYHPDYLGNTEFITDAGGYPYQFFYYSAFGESLVNQNTNTGNFATPYKFNAKEQDPETGNYYYGARYYNPQVSVWLSVDAMASKGPNITPYAFSHNNPVMLVDPDGNWPIEGWYGVTTTFIEGRAAIGVGIGFNFVRQSGVVRDEIGKTHFISQSNFVISGANPEVMGGVIIAVSAGIDQDVKHETFLGQLIDYGWTFQAGAAYGLGAGITFGSNGLSASVGIGLGFEVSVTSTNIVESISLTYDEASDVNDLARGSGSWGITNVTILPDGRSKANVTVNSGKDKVTTDIVIYTYGDYKGVWMSEDYLKLAKEAEGL